MAQKREVLKPTFESIPEYKGHEFVSSPESTPDEDATTCESTIEGSMPIAKHAASALGDAASRTTCAQL